MIPSYINFANDSVKIIILQRTKSTDANIHKYSIQIMVILRSNPLIILRAAPESPELIVRKQFQESKLIHKCGLHGSAQLASLHS